MARQHPRGLWGALGRVTAHAEVVLTKLLVPELHEVGLELEWEVGALLEVLCALLHGELPLQRATQPRVGR